MMIRVKLMASLRSKLPAGSTGGVVPLEIPPASTVTDVLTRLGIPVGHIHLIMVNGSQESNRERPLADRDELVVFPPVAGGAY